MENYTAEYYIDKFSKIPDNKWIIKHFELKGKCCALGHCGMRGNMGISELPEALELQKLLDFRTLYINDGYDCNYEQPTPKARILAALEDVKCRTTQQTTT